MACQVVICVFVQADLEQCRARRENGIHTNCLDEKQQGQAPTAEKDISMSVYLPVVVKMALLLFEGIKHPILLEQRVEIHIQ